MPPTDSKNFCMSPWVHLHGLPNGDFITCCLSPGDKVVGNLKEQSLTEIWNAPKIRKLRTDMLSGGDTSEICQRCRDKDVHGLPSLRTYMNEQYADKFADVVASTTADGHVEDVNIVHWDFRFSNICNFRCRTCGPGFSSNWFDDFYKVENMDPETERAHRKANPRLMRMVDDPKDFWAIMEPLIESVESVHFAGGEPLIMDEHYRILSRMIEHRKFDPYIRYSTNFSTLRYKNYDVLSMWRNFKNVELIMSLDGMGAPFDYLRKGGDWTLIEKNLEDLKMMGEQSGIRWGLHPTISAMNILHIPEFHRWLLETGVIVPGRFRDRAAHYICDFILNNLVHPEYYSAEILPPDLKALATKRLREHARWASAAYGVPADGLDGLIDFVNATDKSHLLPVFRRKTAELDAIRGENFADVFPELAGLLR
jgi:MoaA/NifB/PqqE/SkfB family radical SAM enzyme